MATILTDPQWRALGQRGFEGWPRNGSWPPCYEIKIDPRSAETLPFAVRRWCRENLGGEVRGETYRAIRWSPHSPFPTHEPERDRMRVYVREDDDLARLRERWGDGRSAEERRADAILTERAPVRPPVRNRPP